MSCGGRSALGTWSHLAICVSCREALRQYESIVDDVIPAIAATEETEQVQPTESWFQEQQGQAEKALFDRLVAEEKHPPARTGNGNSSSVFPHRILPFSSESTWRNVWMLYAAGILLFCTFSFFAYRSECIVWLISPKPLNNS